MTGTSADRPATAPVRRQATALSRHGLALIVAAAVGIAMVGGLWALPTHPVDRCEPALAQRLADRSPQTDYTYTAEGTIGRTIPLGSRDVRLDGRHRAPDRLYERYVEGKQLALFGGGADEAVRIGQELWVAPTYGRGRAWEKGLARSVAAPDLAVLPTDRVAFLLEGSTEPSSSVEWAASPTPGGRCRLKGTIVPSAASPARRILTVEVAPDSELPASIHEEWLDYRTPEGERTHDLTWRFQVAAEAPIVEPPAPHLVQPTLDIPPDRASLPPSTVATIDGLGTAVADLEPDAPGRGEVRVTLLEVQEDDSYGEIVPYPGTTFLATRMRQEGIQATSQGAGSMGWELSSSGARPSRDPHHGSRAARIPSFRPCAPCARVTASKAGCTTSYRPKAAWTLTGTGTAPLGGRLWLTKSDVRARGCASDAADDEGSMEDPMAAPGRRLTRTMVGLVAIVAQLALAHLYVGLVVLTVPSPESFAFWAAWGVGLILVPGLAARRSWTAVLVPVVWLGALAVLWLVGEAFLGWGP